MNETLRVNPTRMELSRIRKRLTTAQRGHKLLKDKRDEMVRQFISLIRENARLRTETEKKLKAALGNFALARAVMDSVSLEQAILYPARSFSVENGIRNILSVKVPTMKVTEETHSTNSPGYGFAETSAQLDDAISVLAELLPDLLKLAEIEKTCDLLADEIEKTRRRVNALEYVMIPQFEATIRMITMKLEENERGSVTRLMKVKEMIAAAGGGSA